MVSGLHNERAGGRIMDVARITRAVFRIGVAALFLMHGLQKLFGLFGGKPVALASLLGVAGVLELVGGILLLLGLWTRPVAAVLALEMLTAFVMVHAPRGAVPMKNGGEVPLLYALAFLFLAGNGAGRLSVDKAWRQDKVAEPRDRLRRAA